MNWARLTDILFHAGWLLFFAGIPFSGHSVPGLLLILIHWAITRPKLPSALNVHSPTAAAVKLYRAAGFGLIITYFASVTVAVDRMDALGAAVGNGLMVLFGSHYAFRLELANPGWWRRFLWVVPLTGTAHAVLGIMQYIETGRRVMGIDSNPNAYSTVLLVALYLGAAALAQYEDRRRWLIVPYVVVMVGGLLASGSRGAWVGALAGVLVFGILILRRLWQSDRRRAIAAGVVGLVVCGLAMAALYLTADTRLQARMTSIFNINANQDRVVVYETMWDMIRDNPALGVGMNNLKHRFGEYQGDRPGRPHDIAHNYFLQSLGETGVIGTTFLVLLWFVWLWYGLPKVQAPMPVLVLYSLALALLVRDQFDGALTIIHLVFLVNWLGGTLTGASVEGTAGS